jgi:hypothetical protein
MTRSAKARKSTRAVSEWIGDTSDTQGSARIVGEVARTTAPQALYRQEGQAQPMHSQEMNHRAVDLNRVIDGDDQASVEACTPLADDEVRLDPTHHVWGGHETTRWDAVHVE